MPRHSPLRVLPVVEKPAKSSIQVIGRMMSLLDALARHEKPLNLKTLACETSLHTSTAHRILAVMVENRFVERIEPGTYRLGLRLAELGDAVRSSRVSAVEAVPAPPPAPNAQPAE